MIHAVGNQAGDADSIVSAILAAFYIKESQNVDCVPIVSFPRKDFRLRGDARALFELAKWPLNSDGSPVDLKFLDEVDKIDRVVLTDANVAQSHLERWTPSVVAIFDHHKDEGVHTDVNPRLIDESSGSACSVILKAIFANEKLASKISEQLLILAYGTILMDTRNFSGGRHNDADVEAFATLIERIEPSLVANRESIYKQLLDARHDISHLTTDDLLRLDYKEVAEHGERVGFSTLFATAQKLLHPEKSLDQSISTIMSEKNLTTFVAISAVEKDSERRSVMLCAREKALNDAIISGFRSPPKSVFSPEFLALPLCHSQKIVERGFGLEPYKFTTQTTTVDPHPVRVPECHFSVWTVYGTITRKTLLPAVMELITRSKRL